jgi:demethylmenaquinone methyltransferase/2-methoxy-6-polyprenyl-1,4-benzoquinol methylase
MTASGTAERPADLKHMDPEVWLADPERKRAYVTAMFELIAPRYDRFTRAFSFGMDARWKRELAVVSRGLVGPAGSVLDLACGTGDIAFALAPAVPDGQVFGVDAAEGMIRIAEAARTSRAVGNAHFRVGDMEKLGFVPTASIDLVTVGYGLRNVADVDAALKEIRRVLRPGGMLVSLDFFQPESRWWREVYLAYLKLAGDFVGWLWHRDPTVYGYIARSIRAWLTPRQFVQRLQRHGFEVRETRAKLGGGVCLHVAWRYA